MQYDSTSLELVFLIHVLPVTNFRLQVDLQIEFVSNTEDCLLALAALNLCKERTAVLSCSNSSSLEVTKTQLVNIHV